MGEYTNNLQRDYEDNEEEEIDGYDENLYLEIIHEYKVKDYAAKQHQSKAEKYSEDDGKTDECEEENRQFQKNQDEAKKYLLEIQKWGQGCNEKYQRKKDQCLQEWEYTDKTEKQLFSDFYISLCKFFFNVQIIGATLEEYKVEIKQELKKKVKDCTFYDFAGMDNEDSDCYWKKIYSDLDFVIDEMSKIFLTDYIKKKPLQKMCGKCTDFISKCYNGNYPKFCGLITHYICQLILEEDANPEHLMEDAIGGIILLLADKKSFCVKLYDSMTENTSECIEKWKYEQ